MQIEISTRHGHLSSTTRERIASKVEKLPRLFDRVTAIHVTVDLEKEETPEVEIRVSAEHAEDFVGTERAGSLWESVDLALHKLEQQIRRHKSKDTDRRHGGRRPGASLADASLESLNDDSESPEIEE